MEYQVTTTCTADQLGGIVKALADAGISPKIETIEARAQANPTRTQTGWSEDPLTRARQIAAARKVLEAMGANTHTSVQIGDKLARLSSYNASSSAFFIRTLLEEGFLKQIARGRYVITDEGRKWAIQGPRAVEG